MAVSSDKAVPQIVQIDVLKKAAMCWKISLGDGHWPTKLNAARDNNIAYMHGTRGLKAPHGDTRFGRAEENEKGRKNDKLSKTRLSSDTSSLWYCKWVLSPA